MFEDFNIDKKISTSISCETDEERGLCVKTDWYRGIQFCSETVRLGWRPSICTFDKFE